MAKAIGSIFDISQRFENGDHRPRRGGLYAGALVYLDSSLGTYIPDDINRIAVQSDTRTFKYNRMDQWAMGQVHDTQGLLGEIQINIKRPITQHQRGINRGPLGRPVMV